MAVTHLPSRVGERLRDARREQKISLRTLAGRTGFSASFLSQLERGQVSPSLASLQRIATELGLSLASLVSETQASTTVPRVRRRGHAGLRSEWSLATVELLAPPAELGFEPILITLEPSGRTGYVHGPAVGGSVGLAVCIRGSVVMQLGEQRLILGPGDSTAYGPDVMPAWANESNEPAEVLIVSSPNQRGSASAADAEPRRRQGRARPASSRRSR